MVVPIVINGAKTVAVRHSVRLVMDTKLHATYSCALIGRVVIVTTGPVAMGVDGILVVVDGITGALNVTTRTGYTVGPIVGVLVVIMGDTAGILDDVIVGG